MERIEFPSDVLMPPEDRNFLREIWIEWCEAHGAEPTSDHAQGKAREIAEWFQFGIRDRAQLRSLMEPIL